MIDLDEFDERLSRLADEDYARQVVMAGSELWARVAKEHSPVLTGFNRAMIRVVSVEGSHVSAEAELAAEATYAGYLEFGSNRRSATPFFSVGMIAAEQWIGSQVEGEIGTSMDRILSGGQANPFPRHVNPGEVFKPSIGP